MALTHGIKPIVTSNLILCLDAINSKSYPGSGTTWTDLINSNTASLDTPTFSNGTLNFGSIYDIVSSNYNLTLGSSFSISLWLRHTNSNPVKETYIALGFDKIVVRVNDAGNLNLYVTDATEQNLLTWGGTTGDNTTIPRSTPVTTFAGGTNWKQVAGGASSTAAIKTDGTLWIWGSNVSGKLGINNTDTRSIPVTTFAGGNNWKQVACGGYNFSDGHTAAIKTDGSLWTWGRNSAGQLGINQGNVTRNTPVTTFAGGNTWKQVACGQLHTAAIKTDGTLWTWGRNNEGQLGINNTANRSIPVTTFAGGTDWKQVSAGGNGFGAHTIAIKTDGSLWGWGGNERGQVGDNTTTNRSTPVTTFAGGNTWKSVGCGSRHTGAVKTDGTLWMWGFNEPKVLGVGGGVGSGTSRLTPVTTFTGGTNWKQISGGGYHTSAVKTDGTLWVWGSNTNNNGQLGVNSTAEKDVPVTTFAGGNNWKQVSCGEFHTSAIRTNETTTTDVSISTPILNTTYYNIVATSNGTTLKLYQNNSLLTTSNLNGTLTSTTLFYTISDIMNSFAGNLANIQIHNKELTATEIAQNYDALKSRYGLT
jgi:alpha-tubulin suppressor-like RCC1 family protein